MNTVLFVIFGLKITAWKLVGYSGGFLFTSRWLVQALASRKAGRPTLPLLFWYMSILGSTLLLSYFIFGKNDGVGILTNAFPLMLACYNLFLELTHSKKGTGPTTGGPGEAPAEVV
jgi:lipid-A-disaccharide synthase-like uncharacterized protein